MKRKYNYHCGDSVGNYGVIFIEDINPVSSISASGKRHTYRQCRFLCPSCHKPFIAREENVRRGATKQCSFCGHRSAGEKTKKYYNYNEQIGPDKDVVYITEVPPINIYPTTAVRRAIFYNKKENVFFETDIRNVLRGDSSGSRISQGERYIRQSLDELKIGYIQQYTFNDLVAPDTNIHLRFDFYLPDYNCCIEYDGEQHFQYVEGWHKSIEDFEQSKYRDFLKDEYCQINNIFLWRIPYTELNKICTNFILAGLKNLQKKGQVH